MYKILYKIILLIISTCQGNSLFFPLMPLYNASAVPKPQTKTDYSFIFRLILSLCGGNTEKNYFFSLCTHNFCGFKNYAYHIKTQNYAKSRRNMHYADLSETLRNFAVLFYLFQMVFFHAIGERLTAHSH